MDFASREERISDAVAETVVAGGDLVDSAAHLNLFWQLVFVFTTLSSLGSLFIVVSIALRFRKDLASRLVLHLSVADLGLSLACLILCAYNYVHGHLQSDNSAVCLAQPVITWYFMEVSILLLVVIAINSYKVIFYSSSLSVRQEWIAVILSWSIPLFTTMLPLVHGIGERYGNRHGYWCSFASDSRRAQLINLLCYFVPALLLIVFCYVRIMVEVLKYRHVRDSSDHKRITVIKKMAAFVVAYLVVWCPLCFSYIYEYSKDRYIPFWAEMFFDNGLHLQGMLNFILYGVNQDLLHQWFIFCKESRTRSLSSFGLQSIELNNLTTLFSSSKKYNSSGSNGTTTITTSSSSSFSRAMTPSPSATTGGGNSNNLSRPSSLILQESVSLTTSFGDTSSVAIVLVVDEKT